MKDDTGRTEAGQRYAAAHATHYTTKNLREALELYQRILAAHTNSQEAGYSRSQIQNIVNAVVPKQELLDLQVDLALAHLEHGDQPDVRRARVEPAAAELPSQRELPDSPAIPWDSEPRTARGPTASR